MKNSPKFAVDIRTYADPREAFDELDGMAYDKDDTLSLMATLEGVYGDGHSEDDDCLLDD